ncbi:asparagine synthase (glutamine-hydrolyzing) [Citreimonas sp.]|uniref:asparagine synthase (glutamine-hydrolyzing) n=1 Tax=Citreimonas sp. TaxID=3036715 RepID=UPI0040594CFA
MCGIVGCVSAKGRQPVDDMDRAFEHACDALAHRGPDGRGIWTADDAHARLGHRRLAIVDPSPAGAQPMLCPDSGRVLVYNGEIYNHPALRRELEALGHRYRTRCDSETILHAYTAWGADCVARLRGIFAFAIWDPATRALFAARDHLGVKPLCYRDGDGWFAFASQPRALRPLGLAGVDPQAMRDYLSYGIVPDSGGAFPGLRKLSPAHALSWRDGQLRTWRYWSLPERADITDAAEAEALLADALPRAVEDQLMSDVPVATFLSGGIDSSLVSALAAVRGGAPLPAFTLGFPEAESDERPFARTAAHAIGAPLHEAVLDRTRALALIDTLVEAFDEPFGMGAALPMLAVSEQVAQAGYKVVLSGDGADELFAGYRHYDALSGRYARRGMATAVRARNPLRAALTRLSHGRFDPLQWYHPHEAMLTPETQAVLAGPALAQTCARRRASGFPTDRGAVDAARRYDVAGYLPDEILSKVDRATMHHGVEARVPFLDPELVTLAFRIDPALHHGGDRKALMKRVAARWLPDSMLTARKKGFSPPLHLWLADDALQAGFRALIDGGRLVEAGLLHRDAARRLAMLGPGPTFQIYLAERWMRRWA